MEHVLPAEVFSLLKKGMVIPAIPLALTRDLQFDELRQRALVRYYLDAGAGGLAVAVHSTQFEIRDHQETFTTLLKVVAEEISAFEKLHETRIIRIMGICGKTEQALRETDLAILLNYDIALVSPSAFSGEKDWKALARHYRSIADVMPVFGFYLQESVGGSVLPFEFWKNIVEHKNVVGIKTAPFNRYRTLEVLRAVAESGRSDEIAMYTGNDDNIVFDLLSTFTFSTPKGPVSIDFCGGLLGHWCVWTQAAVALLKEIKKEKALGSISMRLITKAQQITDANSALFDAKNQFHGCIAGLHEVLRLQGFFEDINCYADNGILSEGQRLEIDRVYSSYPDLNDDAFVKTNLQRWFN
jgi:dihydrodipicolinate synthase/N-acetylneuraminate lyase